jgi:hypothetical protein
MNQLTYFRMLSTTGELLLPAGVRRTDGRVRIGYVDPCNIEEIVPDDYNPNILLTAQIKQGYTVDGADLPTAYSLINVDERLDSQAYGRLNFWPEQYGAFYFSVNKPPNSTRGRSDLITVFDWLDLYDQLLFGQAERATYLTDFVWDVTMKGASPEELKKWHRENAMPRGAAMRVHNENMTWQAISPNLNAGDAETMAKLIKQHILTALGLPPAWISDPGDTTRSTGVAMAGPVLKSLSHRQRLCKAILTKILTFVIDQAVLAEQSPLYGLSAEDLDFEVFTPSLTPSDMSALTTTMLKMAQALKLGEDQQWVSHPTVAKMFLKMLTELGVQVAVDEEITRVENLIPRSAQAAQGQGAPGQPPLPGQGQPLVPREATGSELMEPTEQLANQIAGRQITGETTTRKGNPI